MAQEPEKKSYRNSSIVVKMMAFNKKKDGKLTKKEVTDPRLHRLFDMADTNKDGIVTREELMALAAKLDAEFKQGGFPDKGPKGFGDKGPKGFGKGPKGFGPPRPGQMLPPIMVDLLELTPDQRKQLDALQKDVDRRLGKILTEEQKMKLKEFQERGPFGKKSPPPKD
jgi:Spy/CpxP family protein refolding chaperone